MRMRGLVMAAVLALFAAAAEAEAAAHQLTPHAVGWEHYFSVTWERSQWRGRPWLSGYIFSHYGMRATRVQLLVDGLDSSGRVVWQRVEWLGRSLPGFERTYFAVPVPRPATSYRVRLFAFDFHLGP